MKRYMVLYCKYDPDNYRGYFRHIFEVADIESARLEARKEVERRMFHITKPYEFHVYEINYDDSPRLIE